MKTIIHNFLNIIIESASHHVADEDANISQIITSDIHVHVTDADSNSALDLVTDEGSDFSLDRQRAAIALLKITNIQTIFNNTQAELTEEKAKLIPLSGKELEELSKEQDIKIEEKERLKAAQFFKSLIFDYKKQQIAADGTIQYILNSSYTCKKIYRYNLKHEFVVDFLQQDNKIEYTWQII